MISNYTALELARITQGSPEWLQARLGCLSASRVDDAIAVLKRKDGESKPRMDYRLQLVSERIGGSAADHYVSADMIWGTETEPLAREAYEAAYGIDVNLVGIVPHPTIANALCSPDGLVGADGMIEIKCPRTTTHCDYLLAQRIPPEYVPQMLWQLACCKDRKWVDFVSYDPRLPERYRLFVKRMWRDDEAIADMEMKAVDFLSSVDQAVECIRSLAPEKISHEPRSAEWDAEAAITDDDIAWIKEQHAKSS